MHAHRGMLMSVGLALTLGACGSTPPSAPPKPSAASTQPAAATEAPPAEVVVAVDTFLEGVLLNTRQLVSVSSRMHNIANSFICVMLNGTPRSTRNSLGGNAFTCDLGPQKTPLSSPLAPKSASAPPPPNPPDVSRSSSSSRR